MSQEQNGWKLETPQDRIEDYKQIILESLPWVEEDELLVAIYLYSSANYCGQGDINYKIVCLIDLRFSGSEDDLLNDLPGAREAFEILTNHFSK
jgi:hypothetical protein